MSDLLMCLVKYRFVDLMNDVSVLLMNYRLMNLVNYLLVNYINLVNYRLMIFMHYILMMLMQHLLMMFMNYILFNNLSLLFKRCLWLLLLRGFSSEFFLFEVTILLCSLGNSRLINNHLLDGPRNNVYRLLGALVQHL